jgi:helix-turn-helix protein
MDMTLENLERFVDADEAGKFLCLTRRRILDLTRAGKLPGHPIGVGGRRVWRFRLSELATAMTATRDSIFTSRERISMVRGKAVPGRVAD